MKTEYKQRINKRVGSKRQRIVSSERKEFDTYLFIVRFLFGLLEAYLKVKQHFETMVRYWRKSKILYRSPHRK